ncbi:MAG: hypothetical protein KC620_23615, partial [Myxococcales bacterium]|nr:hypothetical protein [Myxococcales bacterium]
MDPTESDPMDALLAAGAPAVERDRCALDAPLDEGRLAAFRGERLDADDAAALAALRAAGVLPEARPVRASLPPPSIGPPSMPPPSMPPPSVPPPSLSPTTDSGRFRAIRSSAPPPPVDSELPPLAPTRQMIDPADVESDAAALAERAAQADTHAERASLLLALAELHRDRLHDPDAAVPHFSAALDIAEPGEPVWVEAIEALEDLHAVRGEWDALLALYDRRLSAGVGEPAEVELLRASILRAAGRMDEAIAAAEKARPAGDRALELLIALLEGARRPVDAAERLLEDLGVLSDEEAAHRRWRAAEMLQPHRPGAALRLFAEAHAELDDPTLIDAWLTLAREVGEPRALLGALEAKVAGLGDDGAEGMRRSGLLVEAAALAESLDDPQRARALLEASLEAWTQNVDALTSLARVLERLDDAPALAEVLTREIDAALPGPHRGRPAVRLARLHAERIGDHEAALRFAAMAVDELDGDETGALSEARALLDAARTPVIAPAQSAAPPSASDVVDKLLARAALLIAEPSARGRAVELLDEALGLAPGELRAYDLLARA